MGSFKGIFEAGSTGFTTSFEALGTTFDSILAAIKTGSTDFGSKGDK